ncbi:hypothetical protein HanRHA438_Chr07g0307531 [Helianthus annuus]|nr:hypothetical protein HanIR_Chr07g0320831 [Helianthus annuus]KAJ0563314.1 hypothetical protein HanHA89_Chr07g0261691 [Helianthus annuus]KAJ0731413.1 hypothetical protein HanOQP8_Chr07g0251661 [Helianthus annuus]KAJ0908183.1 hypothetical protein HanRHA438_Chr07g0307531 [Helianthus annuus]
MSVPFTGKHPFLSCVLQHSHTPAPLVTSYNSDNGNSRPPPSGGGVRRRKHILERGERRRRERERRRRERETRHRWRETAAPPSAAGRHRWSGSGGTVPSTFFPTNTG